MENLQSLNIKCDITKTTVLKLETGKEIINSSFKIHKMTPDFNVQRFTANLCCPQYLTTVIEKSISPNTVDTVAPG